MPIKRLDKTRASLPPKYQYGDMAPWPVRIDRDFARLEKKTPQLGPPIQFRHGEKIACR